ncbi:acylphosphatase [Candidatus Micrarchaeota archaeon]|nr:acylphosphatase [Candidatus Micrarchaeota archaeon]
MTKLERLHVIVSGTVQGVYFRAGAQQKAQSLGLVGFVKNRDDDSVELVAEGERESLEELLLWCSKGPKEAIVKHMEFAWETYSGEFSGFEIIRE